MFNDLRGMAVSSKTLKGVGALDHAIEGYLCMAVDTGERLKAVYAEDAQCPWPISCAVIFSCSWLSPP